MVDVTSLECMSTKRWNKNVSKAGHTLKKGHPKTVDGISIMCNETCSEKQKRHVTIVGILYCCLKLLDCNQYQYDDNEGD